MRWFFKKKVGVEGGKAAIKNKIAFGVVKSCLNKTQG